MKYDFDTLVHRENIGNMKNGQNTPELLRRGLISYSGAEMDFKTAPVIIKALTEFASRGIYGFTLTDKHYIDAVSWWMREARSFGAAGEEIIPTLGTIYALGTAIRAFTQPGDGVILMHPVYYRYEPRITSNGRNIVSAPLSENKGVYGINFDILEKCMAEHKNKLLVLCNPHNPLGKVFDGDDLEHIRVLANKHNVLVFSDEIFGEIGFEGHSVIPYAVIDPDNSIMCTSLGKVFNFTGVNHANVIIKNEELRRIYLAQRNTDHFGSIDPFFYSALLAGYTQEGLNWVGKMKEYVWENYLFIKEFTAANLPLLGISPLEGGFVIWLDFRGLKLDSVQLALFLENEAHIVIDKGEEYGSQGEGFFRMNIASPRRYIKNGIVSLRDAYRARGYR